MTIERSDEYMQESAEDLQRELVGHRIVKAEKVSRGDYYGERLQLTLDDGTKVNVSGHGDCCAYAELDGFLLYSEATEMVITNVSTEDHYQKWFVLASGIPVLDMEVSWSEGSGYYSYGFSIKVEKP